ncbi:MAG: beta galactosidase jelly roll domain-containing protein, partial [Bacteroidota bacterium]|nr:beta galactosidase jelly roll domain-containing protein [Bacteroidota bacterium]
MGILFLFNGYLSSTLMAQQQTSASLRENLLVDFNWRFAFGHPYDTDKDFTNGTSYFSYFAKSGNGDGAASKDFDDRGWRLVNLPHDWAVELPFDGKAGYSHGYKTLGRNFPETSIGWYRKTFNIPASDLGKRIRIKFDGVFRNSIVWVNGFYLGTEHSGYTSFEYDISDYLNYGGDNVVAVRVDATMEEGWFYEGAGIYRHVWLTKTDPLHVAQYGTFVSSQVAGDSAKVNAQTTIINEKHSTAAFDVEQTIQDARGMTVATKTLNNLTLNAGEQKDYPCLISLDQPSLWSIESPYLYKLVTTIRSEG